MNKNFFFKIINLHWYKKQITWWLWLFFPLKIIYKILFLLKKLITKSYQPKIPLIVVGNITLGGTGKTSIVIILAKYLQKKQYKVGIISRGYKGIKHKNSIEIHKKDNPLKTGDEPLLIKQQLENIPVVIGTNRIASIKYLQKKHKCNLIISDDGMQHFKIKPHILITIVDGKRYFGNHQLFPMGPLREDINGLKRADIILINNKCANNKKCANLEIISNKRKIIFNMVIQAQKITDIKTNLSYSIKKWINDFSQNNNYTINAFAAIGNPNSFFCLLKEIGINHNEFIFPNHYFYNKKDFMINKKQNKSLKFIMTTKDSIKVQNIIKKEKKFFALEITYKISNNFFKTIEQLLP